MNRHRLESTQATAIIVIRVMLSIGAARRRWIFGQGLSRFDGANHCFNGQPKVVLRALVVAIFQLLRYR